MHRRIVHRTCDHLWPKQSFCHSLWRGARWYLLPNRLTMPVTAFWRTALEHACRQYKDLQRNLFAMIYVLLPIRIYMTLANVRFAEAMDVKLIRALQKEGILPHGNATWTCSEVVQQLLPSEAWTVLSRGDERFLDNIKFNHVPFIVNPVDSLLRYGMVGGRNKRWQVHPWG